MTIEYRIKPVTKFIVTRHNDHQHEPLDPERAEKHRLGLNISETRQIGPEYDNADTAYEVAYALARQDAERLGYGPGDDRIQYPQHPNMPYGESPAKVRLPQSIELTGGPGSLYK